MRGVRRVRLRRSSPESVSEPAFESVPESAPEFPMKRIPRHRVLPGFGLSLGYALVYLSLLVLIPLGGLVAHGMSISPADFWHVAVSERSFASYRVTFGCALLAACVNAVFGLIVAWVLVRYEFPGKRLIDAAIDLPFALPTAVAGITLTTLYANTGWIGRWLEGVLGFKVAFTPAGIVVALIFIGIPFVVRTVQPVIEDIEPEVEEAAATLGATRLQTFLRVLLPALGPALLTGFTLAFSRALGEYGSVVFIAGNVPMVSEITPLLIIGKLEQYDLPGAIVLAVVMLVTSFLMLLAINLLQWWAANRHTTRGAQTEARP